MIQYIRTSRFRTVLAAALMFSLVQVTISCKDKAPPVQEHPATAKESVVSAAKIGGASASSDLVYVITLHGTVGIIPGESAKAFTAEGLKVSLDAAKKAKATVVVLDIDGPGGQILEMQNMVKVLLEAQVGGMRIVALPRDAFSAWSIVALSCKEILVTPTSRMGAAVSITSNGNGFIEAVEGKDAVSQKFAAPFQALWRQITDITGRPPCIADAMRIQTAELWYSPTKGFAEKSGTESDWQQLDDGVHVLCLTGTEMLKTKMAIGEVRNQSDLPKLLNCDFGTHIENNVFQESLDSLGSNIHGSDFYYKAFQYLDTIVSTCWARCGVELNQGTWSQEGTLRGEHDARFNDCHYKILNLPGFFVTQIAHLQFDENKVIFIELNDLSYRFIQLDLSVADKLNGVEWTCVVQVNAKVARKYIDGSGWQEWEIIDEKDANVIVHKIQLKNGIWEIVPFIQVDVDWHHHNQYLYPGVAPDCDVVPASKTPSVPPIGAPNHNPDRKTPVTSQPTDKKYNFLIPSAPPDVDPKPETKPADTKIVDVPESKWRNGRPLASNGLNVRTQRPVFDDKTTISAGGTNPIFEIEFDKDGVPQNCVILQSSGTQLIDQPILDCMYRWRASGSQLTNLPEGKTLKYRIRMLLK